MFNQGHLARATAFDMNEGNASPRGERSFEPHRRQGSAAKGVPMEESARANRSTRTRSSERIMHNGRRHGNERHAMFKRYNGFEASFVPCARVDPSQLSGMLPCLVTVRRETMQCPLASCFQATTLRHTIIVQCTPFFPPSPREDPPPRRDVPTTGLRT